MGFAFRALCDAFDLHSAVPVQLKHQAGPAGQTQLKEENLYGHGQEMLLSVFSPSI